MASKLACHVLTTIKDLLFTNKLPYENMNMLFLLWNFVVLQNRFCSGPQQLLNIDSILQQVQFDENDELYMTVTGIVTREFIYFSKKTRESYSVLTDRLYSNGVEALLFHHPLIFIEILVEYSTKAIDVCNNKLLMLMKPGVIFTQLMSTMMYFILHLPLLLFQHGQTYPKSIALIVDQALKAITNVILSYVAPFMNDYVSIGCNKMARLDTTKETELILECGEVVAILLNTNISILPESRNILNEFITALHEVCERRFRMFKRVYIGDNVFSLYHTTLLHGLFEMNFKNKQINHYQII